MLLTDPHYTLVITQLSPSHMAVRLSTDSTQVPAKPAATILHHLAPKMNFCVPETSLHTSFQEMLADSIVCPHATHSGCSGQKPPHAKESIATTKQTGTRSQILCFSNSGKTKQDREHRTHNSLGRSLCLKHMGETFSHSADEWNKGLTF